VVGKYHPGGAQLILSKRVSLFPRGKYSYRYGTVSIRDTMSSFQDIFLKVV